MVRGYSAVKSLSVLTTAQLDAIGSGGNFSVVSSGTTSNSGLNVIIDLTTGTFVTDGVVVGDLVVLTATGDTIAIDGIFSEVVLIANGPNRALFQTPGNAYEVRRYGAGEDLPALLLDVVKEDVGYRFIFTDRDVSGNPL